MLVSVNFLGGKKILGATMAMTVTLFLLRRQEIPTDPLLAVTICCDHSLGEFWSNTLKGGDTIGAGIDFSQNRAFYTKNGAFIGIATQPTARGFR
jgi:hypothetical protein